MLKLELRTRAMSQIEPMASGEIVIWREFGLLEFDDAAWSQTHYFHFGSRNQEDSKEEVTFAPGNVPSSHQTLIGGHCLFYDHNIRPLLAGQPSFDRSWHKLRLRISPSLTANSSSRLNTDP
jgi:hypothetical protein